MRIVMTRFIVFLFTAVGHSAVAIALTEAEAVQRGLARSDLVTLMEARRAGAAGNTESAGRWANPEIEYSQETLDSPNGPSEERSLWIRQRLNIAGVRGLERDAAARLEVADNARTAFTVREISAEIRMRFYRSLASDARAAVLADWHMRLQELATAVANRAAAGDASRYDESRLARELALLYGELLKARSEAASARDQLFSQIGSEPVTLQDELLPASVESIEVDEKLSDHPLLVALAAEADSAALHATAAARRVWPEVTIGVGRREITEPGSEFEGELVSLGVEIPLFDRGTSTSRVHKSRERYLKADLALAQNRLAADTRAILRTLDARRRAALAVDDTENAGSNSLAAIAESAYVAGEIGIMELIDAHRTELAFRQEAIARALAAREAYIELQLLTGHLQ